jgi:hypothetical protein
VEAAQNGWEIISAGRRMHMTVPVCKPDGAVLDIEATVEQGLVAPSYGTVCEAMWLRWRWSGIPPSAAMFTITKAG